MEGSNKKEKGLTDRDNSVVMAGGGVQRRAEVGQGIQGINGMNGNGNNTIRKENAFYCRVGNT